jgi:hypothetical protein
VGDECGDGYLERLVKPVKIKDQDKVGNNVGDNKDSPIREKNNIPGNESGKNFQESMD